MSFGLPAMVHFPLSCSRIWNETWLAGFFYKPCNYELFVKQSLNMEMAIVMARVWTLSLLFFALSMFAVEGRNYFGMLLVALRLITACTNLKNN